MLSCPLKLSVVALVLIGSTSVPVHANNPLTNIASEVTQVLNFGQLLAQYLQQIRQFQSQIRRLDHMVEQAQNFDGSSFLENPMGIIHEVRDITRQGQSIGYAVANLDEVMAQRYRNYEAFLAEEYNRETFVDDYLNWTQTTQDSIRTALHSAGVLTESLDEEEAIMQQLQARVANAGTRQQALQAASEVNVINGRSLHKLRELMAANMQIQSSFFQAEAATNAARTAAMQKFHVPQDQAPPVFGNELGWLP